MGYPFTYIYLAYFTAMVVAAVVIALATAPQPARRYLVAAPVCVAGWNLCDVLSNIAVKPSTLQLLSDVFAPCWALVPLFTLLAALSYASHQGKPPPWRTRVLLSIPSLAMLGLHYAGHVTHNHHPSWHNEMYFYVEVRWGQQLVNVYFLGYITAATWVLTRAARRTSQPGLQAVSHFFLRGLIPAAIIGILPYTGIFPRESAPPFVGGLVTGTVIIVTALGVWRRGLFTPPSRLEQQRNQALQHLTRREELLQALPFGVAVVAPSDGRLVFHNAPFARILGLDEAATLPPVLARALRTDSAPGEPQELEVPGPGHEVRQIRLQRIAYRENEKNRWLVGIEDVTRERTLEQRVRRGEQLKALGTLAGGIAHDMNNILAAIMLLGSNLEITLRHDPHTTKDVRRILQACRRGRDLTGNILAYTHQRPPERREVDLAALTAEAIRLHERSMPHGVVVETRITGSLPPVLGDDTQIQQVLTNLILNAAEAMTDGGKVTVRLSEETLDTAALPGSPGATPGRFLRLEVQDTGTGMDEETRRRCFEPLYTTKPIGRGTGLGLAVVHSTVTAHGGLVETQTQLGKGTRMLVHLPAAEVTPPEVAEKAPAPKREPSPLPQTAVAATGLTILLVDDEDTVRRTAQRLLSHLGYHVLEADSGDAALALYHDHRGELDAILLDLVMPDPDGAAVFARLHDDPPHPPVILISGYSREGQVQQLLSDGAAAFLQKPFEPSQLQSTLKDVLKPDVGAS